MPSWLLKAGVQGGISLLPGRHRLNSLLQQHLTGSLALTEAMFEAKLAQCRHHLERLRSARGADWTPRTALEVGTGWYPIVPIGLALAGVHEVTTFDVSSLVGPDRAKQTLESFAAAIESGRLRRALPEVEPGRAERVLAAARSPQLSDPATLLASVGVRTYVGDVRRSGLASSSFELVVSNNTLEHVPPVALGEVLAELRRLAAPAAVMDHFIDISDHYAHFDPSISEFNYLRYRPRSWWLFNNRLQYQNRLRAPDYRRLIETAGFHVIAEDPERGVPDELAALSLAPQFRHYARDDLLVLRTWITAVA